MRCTKYNVAIRKIVDIQRAGIDNSPTILHSRRLPRARMAELVDAPASGAGAGNGVEVRVLFRAPFVLFEQRLKPCETRRNLPYMLHKCLMESHYVPCRFTPFGGKFGGKTPF